MTEEEVEKLTIVFWVETPTNTLRPVIHARVDKTVERLSELGFVNAQWREIAQGHKQLAFAEENCNGL